jgi:hypothetical protein
VPAGASANATTQLSTTSGVPTYLRPQRDKITKVSGTDPVTTAIAASQVRWPTLNVATNGENVPFAQSVVLAGTANLPTMLAGAQVVDRGPLLFTGGASLDPRTAAEMKRVLGRVEPNGVIPNVVILGGADVVSTATENAVKAMGYEVERIAGKDPAAIAVTAAGPAAEARLVFVVDINDTAAYSAAISSLGSWSDQTVLVTNGPTLPDSVKAFLSKVGKDVKVYAVGAGAATALQSWSAKPATLNVTPYVGSTTSATPAILLKNYAAGTQEVVVVNMSSPADVIAGIGLARAYGAPVLALNPTAELDADLAAWLRSSAAPIDNVMVVDSSGALGADFQAKVGGLVSGPLGYSTVANPTAPPLGY